MRFSFALFLIGTSFLATLGAIAFSSEAPAVQAATSSHTIRGKLTSRETATASVPCNQISVRAAVWTEPEEKNPPIEKLELGSTKAQGSTLGNGLQKAG